MRILLLTSEMESGGVETHLLDLALLLCKRGHDVCLASSGGKVADELVKHGVEHLTLPLDKKAPMALITSWRGLVRSCKEKAFDIVHAHSRIAAFVASSVCKMLGICFVTTIHAHFLSNFALDRLSRWGSGSIAVSRDLYYYLLENAHGISPENIRLIENGIDTEKFSPNKDSEGNKNMHIVFLSRLDADCSAGAYSLCRIAEGIRKKYPDVKISIGGGGTELERVRTFAKKVNKRCGSTVVDVLGAIDDVVALMRSADIFVGVSRAALEAMSCAVPTVLCGDEGFLGVADHSTLRVAEHTNLCCRGENGFTDKALARAVLELLDMPADKRKALGNYLRRYVMERHSDVACAQKTEEFYRQMLLKRDIPKCKTLICGYYGFGNLGDELLLCSAMTRAEKEDGELGAALVTGRYKRRSDARAWCVNRDSPIAVMREINRSKRIVFGGGTLLQNSTSKRSLYYYLFLLKYAQARGKPTELWGSGVGEIKGKAARKMTARILCKCDKIELRDELSARRVREIVTSTSLPQPQMLVCEDLALSADIPPSVCADYLLYRQGVKKNEKIAVIALRGKENRRYYTAVKKWIRVIKQKGITPIFVIMYPKQDTAITEKIRRLCGGRIIYNATASDILEIMKRAELVCAQRYHALVLSRLAGTSFIGIGGEEKIRSFCSSHGGVYFEDIEI